MKVFVYIATVLSLVVMVTMFIYSLEAGNASLNKAVGVIGMMVGMCTLINAMILGKLIDREDEEDNEEDNKGK